MHTFLRKFVIHESHNVLFSDIWWELVNLKSVLGEFILQFLRIVGETLQNSGTYIVNVAGNFI